MWRVSTGEFDDSVLDIPPLDWPRGLHEALEIRVMRNEKYWNWSVLRTRTGGCIRADWFPYKSRQSAKRGALRWLRRVGRLPTE